MTTGVGVQFWRSHKGYGGMVYTYLTDLIDTPLRVGDIVTVETKGKDTKAQVCNLNVPADNPCIQYQRVKRLVIDSKE